MKTEVVLALVEKDIANGIVWASEDLVWVGEITPALVRELMDLGPGMQEVLSQ
jgi:hypothetical protein